MSLKNACSFHTVLDARAALQFHLAPRTVVCSRGGLFTGLTLQKSALSGLHGGSARLDICCTTSIIVEGFGDLGATCAKLGNGEIQ
jgi:hypothetical protein